MLKKLKFVLGTAVTLASFLFISSTSMANSNSIDLKKSEFVPRKTAPSYSNPKYYRDNPLYQLGYGMPNCTTYAIGRAWELLGEMPNLSINSAYTYWSYNKQTNAYPYGSKPRLGAVAVFSNSPYGHVGVVEKIYEDGSFDMSHSAWGGQEFEYLRVYTDGRGYYSNYLIGFIYIGDWDNEDFDKGQVFVKNSDGAKNQWKKIDNNWYYFNGEGKANIGWFKDGSNWFLSNKEGIMQIGWKYVSGKWYYLNSGGYMQKGFINSQGKTYYLQENGAMKIGWSKINDTWYYFNDSGEMLKGTQIINNITYKFDDSGRWVL